MSAVRVAVCDDEVDVLHSTQMVLQINGFEVTPISDARALLETLRRVKPQLLLQDVYMPGLKLQEAIGAIRADPALLGLKILVFTASAEGAEICRKYHADGYLRKPFDAARIRQTLEGFLKPAVSAGR